jgi:hypothetical protein
MELLPLILTIVASYGVFLFLAYVLARLFFPTIHVDDAELKEKRHHAKNIKHLAH